MDGWGLCFNHDPWDLNLMNITFREQKFSLFFHNFFFLFFTKINFHTNGLIRFILYLQNLYRNLQTFVMLLQKVFYYSNIRLDEKPKNIYRTSSNKHTKRKFWDFQVCCFLERGLFWSKGDRSYYGGACLQSFVSISFKRKRKFKTWPSIKRKTQQCLCCSIAGILALNGFSLSY